MSVIAVEESVVETAPAEAICWSAVIAGGLVAAALTIFLGALGVGLGLTSVSPWADSGVSTTTFKVAGGIYLVLTACMASALGGHFAGRFRHRWYRLDGEETYFRDSAHGFLSWAFATVLTVLAIGLASTHAASLTGGTRTSASTGATDYYADTLLRPAGTSARVADPTIHAEVNRILVASAASGDVSSADRGYLGQIVSGVSGLPRVEADQRVASVIAQAKDAADRTRKSAAQFAFWLAFSLIVGAFAAALTATEGGRWRDKF